MFLILVSYSFHFCAVCCCNVGRDGIFTSLQVEIFQLNVRLIGLKYSDSCVVCSSRRKLSDYWYEIYQASTLFVCKWC